MDVNEMFAVPLVPGVDEPIVMLLTVMPMEGFRTVTVVDPEEDAKLASPPYVAVTVFAPIAKPKLGTALAVSVATPAPVESTTRGAVPMVLEPLEKVTLPLITALLFAG